MTDGTPGDTPLADESVGVPAELHRTAQGIIAARDARIEVLVRALDRVEEKRLHALAAARVNGETVDDYKAALAEVRRILGNDI